MPLVVLQYKAGRDLEALAKALALQMPKIVAVSLDTSSLDGEVARLTPDDIEVWPHESSSLGVNTKDIEIVIWTHEFPGRREILEERKDEIVKSVRKFLSDWDKNISGFVWVLLQPTAFGTL